MNDDGRSDRFLSDMLDNISHFLIVGDESYDSHLSFANRTLQKIDLKNFLNQPDPERTDLSVYRVSFPPFLDLFKFCFFPLFLLLSYSAGHVRGFMTQPERNSLQLLMHRG